MLPPKYDLLFQLQGSLLNSVAPTLRAVTADVDIKAREIYLFFFYDGEVSYELFELASVASVTIDLDLPGHYTFPSEIATRLDFPKPIPIEGNLAFLRKEPSLPVFEKEDRKFLLEHTRPLIVLLLDVQESLLGKVTTALRQVSAGIDLDQKLLKFYFFYDGPISEEDFNLATLAIQESCRSFPDYQLDAHIERVDFPADMDAQGCTAVYWRFEIRYGPGNSMEFVRGVQ